MNDIFDLGLSHQRVKPPLYRRFLQLPAIGLSLLVFVAIIVVGVSTAGKYLKPPAPDDYVGEGYGSVTIEVSPNDTVTEIANTLVKDGVVKTVSAFTDAARYNNKAQDIQPGVYKLNLHMSATSALTLLLDPHSLVGARITIPEGSKLSTVESIIASKTQISAAQIETALQNPTGLGLPDYAKGNAEGFLFPATYNTTSSTTATSLLTQMVDKFGVVTSGLHLAEGAKKLNLTPYQVVIIASLIEAEVKRPQDYAQVAEVIDNRLRKGMKLQLDSTVNYALGTSKPFLTQSDLKTESPYNTYVITGLPPAPINSPGEAALKAALNPATGDLLYFVTIDPATGETVFTNSESTFEDLRRKAQSAAASAAASPGASAGAGGSGGAASP